MALNDFKEDFILRYEDITSKVLVGKEIANFRFQPNMKFGDNVNRFVLDLSSVRVRAITNLQDRTIDPVTDTTETMPITIKHGLSFPLSHSEEVQAGHLSPAMVAGKQIAIKINSFLDAQILKETMNASTNFDTGNLTTLNSTGTPISLSSTTIPQMVTMTQAKLATLDSDMSNLVWVLDPVSLGMIAQFPIGKDITSENRTFMNGFKGALYGAKVYVSNNLTGEAVLSLATQPTANDTVTVQGVAFKFVASPSAAGDVDLGSDVDGTRANLAAAINGGAGAGTAYIEVSSADRIKLSDTYGITATNDDTANTLTIVGVGASRLTVAEALTNATDTWTKNFVHCYYGQKGAIDVAVQEKPDLWTRDEPKQRTTNYFVDIVAAIKTFADGAVKFLDVHVSA
jgi:hypothetical protein